MNLAVKLWQRRALRADGDDTAGECVSAVRAGESALGESAAGGSALGVSALGECAASIGQSPDRLVSVDKFFRGMHIRNHVCRIRLRLNKIVKGRTEQGEYRLNKRNQSMRRSCALPFFLAVSSSIAAFI
jgi:hypothetical protein